MSTRCNIIIKDRWNNRVYLYHHHDGYPSGVGADIARYLNSLNVYPTRRLPYRVFNIANDLIKGAIVQDWKNWDTGEMEKHTDDEYEVTPCVNGDIEYLYVINEKAQTFRCYSVPWSAKGEKFNYQTDIPSVVKRENLCDIPGWNPAL